MLGIVLFLVGSALSGLSQNMWQLILFRGIQGLGAGSLFPVALAVIGDLGLDRTKVNPLGGAIALGHPLGATGAIRVATLMHGLKRTNKKYGMVTMCVGMWQGAAGVFERV